MKARERQQLERCLKGSEFKTSPEKDRQVLERALDRFRKNEQNMSPVSLWRLIMKSPITRVAAVLLLIAGLAVMSWQSPASHSNDKTTLAFLTLINTASAAEQNLFRGESIVHITHEITLYPNTDAPDMAAKLDQLLESTPTS